MRRIRAHIAGNAVGYLALFVALGGSSYAAVRVGSGQIQNNSVKSVDLKNNDIRSTDIRNGTIRSKDVGKGTLLASNFKSGQLPAGQSGQNGQPGPQGPAGPTFGDSKLFGLVDNIACNGYVSVGSMPLTVKQPARIWVGAQGSIKDNNANLSEVELFARLRDAGNTLVASSPAMWDSRDTGDTDRNNTLTTSGVLHVGAAEDEDTAAAYVAAPGTYTLELAVNASGDCSGGNPDFGLNENGALTYVLLGTG